MWWKRLSEVFAVVVLISLGVFFWSYKLPMVSATYDEGFSYLGNGEYLVKNFKWDRDYILLHPPLSYYLHGASSLLFPTNNSDDHLLIARFFMLPIYIIFAIVLYTVVKKWYGIKSAFYAMILYLFNPEILAHGRLITPDHLLAFFIFLTLIFFYYFLQKPKLSFFILTSISLGLALLTKYTGLLLIPLLCILGLMYLVKKRRHARLILFGIVGMTLVALLIVHAGYLFKETGRLPEKFISQKMIKLTSFPVMKSLLTILFPRAYLEGTDFQMHESEKGVWWGYFAGKYYGSGLWYFYPAVFLIKTSLPLLVLIFIAVLLTVFKRIKTSDLLQRFIFLSIVWFFIYFMFFNRLIIGLRYLLMIYPLIILFISPIINLGRNSLWGRIYRIFLLCLLIWYVGGSIKIAPFYLAYANELIGGSKNLWKYVADSNLDWDQDKKFFAQYRQQHPELTAINPHKSTIGKIAVNVNDMNLYYYHNYQWLRQLNKNPVEYIGYTWLIFEIKENEIKY